MTEIPNATVLEAIARELWEAHATHHQAVIPFPQEHWDQLDPFTQDHWRHIARTALTFRPAAAGDHATPNLPSRDFETTSRFYAALGFAEGWRDDGWMILKRGSVTLEFFLHPELDPLTSWFSACLRLEDLEGFYAVCQAAGLPESCSGQPRLHPPATEPWGGRVAALIDRDGTLIRLIQNPTVTPA